MENFVIYDLIIIDYFSVLIRVNSWLLDPSTEFILSVVERTQGMLIGNKHDLKKQSQFTRIACCVLRAAKWNLKKQSQFAVWQIDVKSYMKGYYEEFQALGRRKNKANSKPISLSCLIPKG